MRNAKLRLLLFIPVALILLIQPLLAGYRESVANYNQKKYKEAIQEMKPEIEQNPNWEPGHRILGLSYLALGDNAQAVSELSQAIKLNSPVFSTYLGLAQAYFNRKEYGKCIDTLNDGENIAAKDKDASKQKLKMYELRGSANFRAGKYNEAVSDLANAIRLDPSDAADFFALGAAYLKLDRVDEGIQALEKCQSMKPGQASTTDLLGKAYFQKGLTSLEAKQYATAIQSLLKAKDYDTDNGHIYYRLGEAYLLQKNYGEAEKALNKSIGYLNNDADAYERLGLVYEKQKRWDDALKAYKKAEQVSPSKGLKDAIKRVTENKQIPDQPDAKAQPGAKAQGAKTR
jgi:tetratricopeptide (TPR) repeat protein